MPGKTMVLTVEELEAIRDEAIEAAKNAADDRFTVEEMKAIREQYERRLADEQQKREDLEWRLRMAVARLGDAEATTEKLRAVQESLRGILGEVAEDERAAATPPPLPPSGRRVSPPAVPARPIRKDFKRAIA